MPRIPTINPDSASAEQQQILTNVQKGLGLVPNLVAALAQSPAAANAYLAFSGALAKALAPPETTGADRTGCRRDQLL